MSQAVIMCAHGLIAPKKKATIADIISIWPDGSEVVVVAERDGRKIFISGSGGHYYNVGDRIPYKQDTGNGYGARGTLVIENEIQIQDGRVTDKGNSVGLREKRPIWVFK